MENGLFTLISNMFHPSLKFALLAVFVALCFSEAYGAASNANGVGYGIGTSSASSQNDGECDGQGEGEQGGCEQGEGDQGEGDQGEGDQGEGDQGGCGEVPEGCQARKKRSPEDALVSTASASGFGNGTASAISTQKGSGGERGDGDSGEGDSGEGDSGEGDSGECESEEGDSEEGDSEEECDGSCDNCNERKKRSPEFRIFVVPRTILARAETSRYRDAAGSATGYGQGSGSSQS